MLACSNHCGASLRRHNQIFNNEQKQAFSAFEMEEDQNATVRGLVLVLQLMLSKY